MRWYPVRVRGEEVRWPDECACCGARAGEWLAISNFFACSETAPLRWQVPACALCARHAQPVAAFDDFNRDTFCYGLLYVALSRLVRGALWSRGTLRRGPNCACAAPAVRHHAERHHAEYGTGARDPLFEFARPEYAARFAALNPTLPTQSETPNPKRPDTPP